MLNANDLLMLVKAGFTKEDIMKLQSQESAPAEEGKPDQEPEKPDPASVVSPDQVKKNSDSGLEEKVADLQKKIESINRSSVVIPSKEPETVDDVMAKVFNLEKE